MFRSDSRSYRFLFNFSSKIEPKFRGSVACNKKTGAPSRDNISRRGNGPPVVYLLRREGETSRRIRKSVPSCAQVGQGTSEPGLDCVYARARMESFPGHSRGNSIRHTKSSAQDASRNSTLSLNSASLKMASFYVFPLLLF